MQVSQNSSNFFSKIADVANAMTFDPESHVQDHVQFQKLAAMPS